MTIAITPKLLLMDRDDWGADPAYPRLGQAIAPVLRTEAIHHHSVAIDNDATPNLWESLSEIKVKMRQLQTIRPDLGMDVPYNYVAFLMNPSFSQGMVIVCEGRGAARQGAHTKYHNQSGIAVCFEGNMEDYYIELVPFIPQLSRFWGYLRYERGLTLLGSVRPERGGEVFGHRDFAQTACPGKYVMQQIEAVGFTQPAPPQEEDDMKPLAFVKLANQRTYLVNFAANTATYTASADAINAARAVGHAEPGPTPTVHADYLTLFKVIEN